MKSNNFFSYLWVDDLSTDETLRLFKRAREIKSNIANKRIQKTMDGQQVALVFSEASTRTKMSFQLAAQRLGAQCMIIDNLRSTSMSKGETFADTFWTLHSIRPDLFVIRCGDQDPLLKVAEMSELPIINAGFGSQAHPTQALLDTFTMLEHFGQLEGLKVLIVGDIDHSRVAASGIKLLKAFGANVKICAPDHFCRKEIEGVERLPSLEEAIPWCDVYMGLRVQFERHGGETKAHPSKQEFQNKYRLDRKGLNLLGEKAVIMHPGPANWGVEFDPVVQEDSRLMMWKQKENGVYTRAALMEHILKVGK